ncbi:MAG: hypothetical protein IPK64_02045 [bacterium]|nr:hypothetical protein [bacterium]
MLAPLIRCLATAVAAASVFAVLVTSSGCSGYRQYDRSEHPQLPTSSSNGDDIIAVGKSIRVRTARGIVVEGKVESVGQSECMVDGESVPYSEIESIRVRSFLWTPTVVAVGAAAFVVRMITYDAGTFSPDLK